MASQENKLFIICRWGPKCSRKYLDDFNRRVAKGLPGDQGTGDMAKDLEAIAEGIGLEITVEKADCFELCPLPWERSNVETPDGKIRQVYYDDLPGMFKGLKNNP